MTAKFPSVAGSGAVDSVNGETGIVTLDADEIPFTPAGTIAATDVQAAIQEAATEGGGAVAADLATHIADTSDAHDASAISFVPVDGLTETNVQDAIPQVWSYTQGEIDVVNSTIGTLTSSVGAISDTVDDHIADTADAHDASAVSFAPAGSIAATNVQTAIAEVATEAQPLDSDLTAIAGLSPSNDDVVQRKSGAWTNRTMAQVKTDLALTKTDVGLSNVTNVDHAAALAAHEGDATAAHAGSAISFSPTGSVAATTVQAAIAEVAAEAGAGTTVSTDSIWNAKGDLAGGTGSDTAVRLGVGTNGHVLTADSAETTGMKWAAGGGGALPSDAEAIRYVSSLGSDSNGGLSEGEPMLTLAAAYADLPSTGGKLVIAPGRYDVGSGLALTRGKPVWMCGSIPPPPYIVSTTTAPLSGNYAIIYTSTGAVSMITTITGTAATRFDGLRFEKLCFEFSDSDTLYAIDANTTNYGEIRDCYFFADKTSGSPGPAAVTAQGFWIRGTASYSDSDASWWRVYNNKCINMALGTFGNLSATYYNSNQQMVVNNVGLGLNHSNTSCLPFVSFYGAHRSVCRDNNIEAYNIGVKYQSCYMCTEDSDGGEYVDVFVDMYDTKGCSIRPQGITYAPTGSTTPKVSGAILVRGDIYTKACVIVTASTWTDDNLVRLYEETDGASPSVVLGSSDNIVITSRKTTINGLDPMDAADLTFTPTGTIAATTVQDAIAEVNTEKQPLDTDLTTIAGLTATTDNFIQAKSSAWASRTPAQVKTDLALTKSDVGLSNVTNVDHAAALATHEGDTSDAHDASAISFSPTGTIASTDVQAALAEVASEAGGGGAVATDAIWDAKGDLAGGTGANTAVKLTVGTNGQVLTADSAETTGMKWSTAGSGSVAADAIWDAKGDLAGGTGADTAAKLTVGANGTTLEADSSQSTGMKWTNIGVPKIIRKTADETISASTTLQDDDHLLFAVAASEVWFVEAYLTMTSANATMDCKFGFTGPTSATMTWGGVGTAGSGIQGFGVPAVGVAVTALNSIGGSLTVASAAGGNLFGVALAGTLTNSTNTGNLTLQWAQATSDGGNLIMKTHSFLRATRLA